MRRNTFVCGVQRGAIAAALVALAACAPAQESPAETPAAEPPPVTEPDAADPPPSASREEPVAPREIEFTIADVTPADSPLRVVRSIRCTLTSPRDLYLNEIQWPRIEMPDGWRASSTLLPFEGRHVAVRRDDSQDWTVDIHRTSAGAPFEGDVTFTFRTGGLPGVAATKTPSNAVRLTFPKDVEPQAFGESHLQKAVDEGFLLRLFEFRGSGNDRSVRVRPDGSFRALIQNPLRPKTDRTGTLPPAARSEIAALLREIRIDELLAEPRDQLDPRQFGKDSLVTVVFAAGDALASRAVLGSKMRTSPEWQQLTRLLREHTEVAVPGR